MPIPGAFPFQVAGSDKSVPVLALCAVAIFALVSPRCDAGEGDLDQRIQKQELAMEHAWSAALDARDTYWREQQDWAHGWPSMVHQDRAERYTEILWRRYDKAMRIWQHECRTLVTLYSERRAQSE